MVAIRFGVGIVGDPFAEITPLFLQIVIPMGAESEGIAALLQAVNESTEQTKVDTIRTLTRAR